MDEKLSYWVAVVFSAIGLVLVILNVSLANSNSNLQRDVAARQQTLNAGVSLNQLNQGLVQALAESAFKNNNAETRELLASQGITLRTDIAPPPSVAPAPAPAPKKK